MSEVNQPSKSPITRAFEPLGLAILTVSDSRSAADDRSGALLQESATQAGHRIVWRRLVRDELAEVVQAAREAIADADIDVLLCTGGTGITARDITPDALESLGGRILPGFGELFRQRSVESLGSAGILSRAVAYVVDATFLFALPGSPGGCRDAWRWILEAQLDNRTTPCSLSLLRGRLRE